MNIFKRKLDDLPGELSVPKTAVVRQIDKEVKAVLAEFADLREERDRAMDLVKSAKDHIIGLREENVNLKNENARLQDDNADLKSRTTVYQLERDQAVTKYAQLDSLMKSLKAMLDAHGIVGYGREPVAPDAENSIPALDYKVPEPEPPLPPPPTPDELLQRIKARAVD